MTSISATAAGPSCLSQGEGPPSLPHRSVEELTDWFSSEIHSFLSTNNVCAPIVVPTQADYSEGPEPAHINDHQGHPEGITTLATAIIPFSGRGVPTMVVLNLVPLHLEAGQYTPSPEQGGELGPFLPSHLSEPSRPSMDYPMATDDITTDPRYLECAPSPGNFTIASRNSIPQSEVRYDHQPSVHDDTTQEPMPSPGVAVYPGPPPFDQVRGAYPGYLFSGHLSPPTLLNSGVVLPAHSAYQNEGNVLSLSGQLPGQIYQDTPTFFTAAGPIGGVGVDQLPRKLKCTMCDLEYDWLSGLTRHYKDIHLPWLACDFSSCDFKYSSGRKYLLAGHLKTHHRVA